MGREARRLTFREAQVVRLIAEEFKLNKEIASDLHLGTDTVTQYVRHAMAKTGARNRVELAVRYARGEFTLPGDLQASANFQDHE